MLLAGDLDSYMVVCSHQHSAILEMVCQMAMHSFPWGRTLQGDVWFKLQTLKHLHTAVHNFCSDYCHSQQITCYLPYSALQLINFGGLLSALIGVAAGLTGLTKYIPTPHRFPVGEDIEWREQDIVKPGPAVVREKKLGASRWKDTAH